MKQIDLTRGSIPKQILSFAIPILCANLIEILFTTVDRIVVGRFVGADALGSVGVASVILMMIIAISGGLFIGCMILVSQVYGAKEHKRLEHILTTSYFFLFFLSGITAVLGIVFSGSILKLIATPAELFQGAKNYLQISFLGIVGIYGFFGVRSLSQGVGDPKTPLYFLLFTAFLNIGLDLLFVWSFGWGLEGAAYATIVSQFLSFFLCAIYFAKTNHPAKLVLRWKQFSVSEFIRMLKIGLPAALHFGTMMGLMILMQSIVNRYDKEAANAYSAIFSIESIFLLLPMSIGQALSSFTGQNMGAKQLGRLKAGLGTSLLLLSVYIIFLLIVIWLFVESLIGLFSSDTSLIAIGTNYFRIVGFYYIVIMSCTCLQSFFEGVSKSQYAMFSSFLTISVLLLMVGLDLFSDLQGLWYNYIIAYMGTLSMLSILYFRRTWQNIF